MPTDGNLILRAPNEADAAAIADAVRLSLSELRPWMPWAVDDYDESSALFWLTGQAGDTHRFVMIDSDGELIGTCGLNREDKENQQANLGYWVRTDRTGRGYATTATKLLAQFGLGPGGYHRLEVIMSVHNDASRRVAEKAGATYEGVARGALLLNGAFHDTHVWSYVSGDLL